MKTTKEKYNAVILVNESAKNYKCNRSRQIMIDHARFDWHSIDKCYLMESEIEAGPYVGLFYKVLFDYTVLHSPFAVVLISDRVRTTDFENSFSLN